VTLKFWFVVNQPANLCTVCTSLKSADPGHIVLPLIVYGSIFSHFYTASPGKTIG